MSMDCILSDGEEGRINRGFDDIEVVDVESLGTSYSRRSSKIDDGGQQPAKKQQEWERPIEFLFSCIAMSVGLGNIWRFPYTAYANGGGAFLIPYFIVLFLIGKPLYFLELSIGQFSSKGQVKVWKMAPLFKGVGYGSAFGTSCVVSYYCSIMAITVYYFIQSFNSVLPWSVCNPAWGSSHNVTCIKDNTEAVSHYNKSIPELYFKIDVLREHDRFDEGLGYPDWRLALCLLFSWLVIFVSLIKGVKSAGKVAYFTALFPYVVLIILLIRGITLEGAINGIWYFIKPQWSKLLEVKVWQAAISQCFFSMGVGFGAIIMLGSYNPFSHNVYRDAMIISLADTLTSLLAGFTIFSILGYLAAQTNRPVSEVAGAGPALAFSSYPLAISKFEFLPQLFAVLFFLMLFTLGVGTVTSLVGGLIRMIQDRFPTLRKAWLISGVCIVGFLSGLIYVTPGGQWMIELVDNFGANFVLYMMATLEIIGVAWVYGIGNICRDIEFMLRGKLARVSLYWRFCWGAFIPVVLIVIMIQSLINMKNFNYYGDKENVYPTGYLVFGWTLALFAILLIPASALHSIMTGRSDSLKGKLKKSAEPSGGWGPADPQVRKLWLEECEQPTAPSFFTIHKLKQILGGSKSFWPQASDVQGND